MQQSNSAVNKKEQTADTCNNADEAHNNMC